MNVDKLASVIMFIMFLIFLKFFKYIAIVALIISALLAVKVAIDSKKMKLEIQKDPQKYYSSIKKDN